MHDLRGTATDIAVMGITSSSCLQDCDQKSQLQNIVSFI